jgi:hypothetical protein
MRRVIPVTLLALCAAAAAFAATSTNNPFNSPLHKRTSTAPRPVPRPAPRAVTRPRPSVFASPAPKRPAVQPMMSTDGLAGLRQLFVQAHVTGEAKWLAAVGTDEKRLKAEVEARVRRLPGLIVTQTQSPEAPRLLVQVVGHTIPGYRESDPPAAAHLTLAVMQPVILARRGPAGQPIRSNGMTYHSTVFSTNQTSNMRTVVQEKVAYLLDEFEKDCLRANPKLRKQ